MLQNIIMDTDTSFLLSSPHCFSHWYHREHRRTWDYTPCARNGGAAIWHSTGVQARSVPSISRFHWVKTTLTDDFSHNTKHLLKNFFFFLTSTDFIRTTSKKSTKTTVLFYAHRRGFKQMKRRKFLITIMVINTEAAIPGQTKDVSSLTSSPWQRLLSPLVWCFSISTLWSLTASIPSSAVPHNHSTSPFPFPSDTLFHRGPNTFVGSINTVHYLWRLVRHSKKLCKTQVLQHDGLHNWICNLIV